MIAIGYVRRSKLKKSDDERVVSLEAQAEAIQRYSKANGMTLASTLVHNGISGRKNERFEQIEAAVISAKATAILVYHLDRFGRNAVGVMGYLAQLTKRGIALHEVAGCGLIDSRTALARLSTGMRAQIDQFMAEMIGEKTKGALAHLKSAGRRYTYIPPMGWTYRAGKLVVNDQEQDAIRFILAQGSQGLGAKLIRRKLGETGYRGRGSVSAIAKVLKNKESYLSSVDAAGVESPNKR